MKNPFKISFREEISEIPNKAVLESFKANFSNTFCDKILINGDKELVVINDSSRWRPDMNWNLWAGIKNAKVTIDENPDTKKRTVEYSIDLTPYIYKSIFIFLTITFLFKISGFWGNLSSLSLIIYAAAVLITVFFVNILRHRSIFKRTLKFGAFNQLGNYDWDTILKNKTDLELQEIINGQRILPEPVVELAKTEFEKRRKNE